ncbi:hypothetical protein F5051DRAFT_412203 [Lentinula edodes]|nr:hypothetical protein F5051DRAFT_412203 [Lentinula edodes]
MTWKTSLLYWSMLRLDCALKCALSFPGKMDQFLDLSGWRRMVLCDVREYTLCMYHPNLKNEFCLSKFEIMIGRMH